MQIIKSIEHISTKADKAFLVEWVNLYVRCIECLTDYFCLDSGKVSTKEIETECCSIGFIEDTTNYSNLLKVIGKDLASRLYNAVSIFLNNRCVIEPHIIKLRQENRIQIQKQNNSKYTFVDFFCGAGGMSLGFSKAGFNVALANDIVDECLATYELNHPETPSANIIKNDIRSICNNIEQYIDSDIDVVVGGPPCQGFSSANRQRIIDDPRNELYKYYVTAIQRISPKFVVMENVKGMLSVANQVVEDFAKISYLVAYRLINAADYGVPQNRIRLIYIGVRQDIAKELSLTPDILFSQLEKYKISHAPFNLSDALINIKALSSPRVKGLTEIDDELTGKKVDINHYAENHSTYLDNINEGRTIPLCFNHKARYASDVNFKIFSLLEQGEDASNEKIKGIMPYEHRLHCFKDKYYKLIEDRPCRTITAHLKMDCLSHIHPTQTRTITPREAARVQSFPDDYIFLGAYLKTYMQIGNAVPVLLAQSIANVIKQYI